MTAVALLTQSPAALLKMSWGDMDWIVDCWLREVLAQLPWSPQWSAVQSRTSKWLQGAFLRGLYWGRCCLMSSLITWTLVMQWKVASASLWMTQKGTVDILEGRASL